VDLYGDRGARAGFMADAWGVSFAVWVGGLICLAGVITTGLTLLRFWAYRGKAMQAAEVGTASLLGREPSAHARTSTGRDASRTHGK